MKINTVQVTGSEKITAYGGGKRNTITSPDLGGWGGWKNHEFTARALADVLGYPVETTIACDGPLERRGRFGFAFTVVDYTVCWKCSRVLNDPDTGFDDATPYRLQAQNIDPEWTGAPDLVLCRVCTNDPGAYEQACATVRAWWMYSERT